jgi:hypothetical protein
VRRRFDGPVWRIVGVIGAWLGFAFFTVLVLRASMAVMDIGGSCASGGPYVIGVECPRAVLIVIPWAFFLAIAVVIAGAAFQRGFGTPILSWAWGLAFGVLGIESIISGIRYGAVWFVVGGLMFLLLSAPVLVYEFRASPLRMFVGATNLREQGFFVRTGHLRRMIRRKPSKQDYQQVVEATVADGVLALSLSVASAAAGAWLGWITFDALG